MVPNVQNAWDQFVEMKYSDAMKDALNAYDTIMSLQLKDKLPCDNDRLRNGHGMALKNSEAHLMAGISANTIETFLKILKVRPLFGLHDPWWRYVWEYFLIIACSIYSPDWHLVKSTCEKKRWKRSFLLFTFRVHVTHIHTVQIWLTVPRSGN